MEHHHRQVEGIKRDIKRRVNIRFGFILHQSSLVYFRSNNFSIMETVCVHLFVSIHFYSYIFVSAIPRLQIKKCEHN